ncbi:MAG TPA: ABC transporter substrate-binding protein [Firmicutes bacterium]|jgi:NitT/TauT family transport system substrate-binding protein|nr:ABC transporter substrate-binding protein [Bacillota bacterium]
MKRSTTRLGILLAIIFSISIVNFTVAAEPMPEIKIAGQFGLVYAPLMIADKLQIFEKNGLKPVWKEYGSGAAVREALISGEADVGFMGIPPFLIGWDKGCPWKVAMGFVVVPVGLVTNNPRIKSLKDFKPSDKIAVPSPGSVQHILLAMAAEKELGSPNALDTNIMAMPHPDAVAALISKKGLAAHFTTPPYLFEELNQPGFHLVSSDKSIFGRPFSFNVGVASKKFHDEKPLEYLGFVKAINNSFAWLNGNMPAAATILAPEFKLTPQKTLQYLKWPGMDYTTRAYGLMEFAYFMKRAGFLKKIPTNANEIIWENVKL